MEDRIIVKSEQYNFKRVSTTIFCIIGGIFGLGFILFLFTYRGYSNRWSPPLGFFETLWEYIINGLEYLIFPSDIEYCITKCWWEVSDTSSILMSFSIIPSLIWSIIAWYFNAFSITVTDKRIIGHSTWGKKVSIPVDSVSAIASSSFNGIAVASSSGKIVFKLIKNRDEVHQAIENLIIARQNKAQQTASAANDNLEALKKYKELLDTGVITEAEFEAKKKETLGL